MRLVSYMKENAEFTKALPNKLLDLVKRTQALTE